MTLLEIASSLWLKTHTLQLEDLKLINDWDLKEAKDWIENLSNPGLLTYLKQHPHWQKEAEDFFEDCKRHRILWVHYFDDLYPLRFTLMDRPPLFLTYQGNLVALQKPTLAVVGARDVSMESLKWLDTHLYRCLKLHEFTTISGAAIGVDQQVHFVSSMCKQPTVAIFPSGLLNMYPKKFMSYAEDVLQQNGLLLSEYSLAQAMAKHHFYQRNRLIAALGDMLLVVEAKRKSGSLISAKYAMDMGKDVLVLPSSPFDIDKLGSLDLLFDGAYPVRDAEDLQLYLYPHLFKAIHSN